MAIIILFIVLGVLAIATAGITLTRRRAREMDELQADMERGAPLVVEEPRPEEAPRTPLVIDEPPVAPTPPVELPPVEAPPVVEAPPQVVEELAVIEAPPVVVPAPVVEPPAAVEAPKARKRVRGFGSSIKRLFRGTALTDAEWDELEEILLRADVGVLATSEVLSSLRERKDVTGGMDALRSELIDLLGTDDRSLKQKSDGLTVWLVTGVNGVGKTTTIGKLAARLQRDGTSTILAAADTFRAAADDQLHRWADLAGAEIVKHAPGADPAAVVFDGVKVARERKAGALIVDTAGRLQTKKNLMEELSKIRRVLEREAGEPDEVLLVLDATTGQNGLQQARAFADAAQITGLVLTKLDGTAKGGIVIAVQLELGIPVKLVGLGEGIDDLAPFVPEDFVDDLLAIDDAES